MVPSDFSGDKLLPLLKGMAEEEYRQFHIRLLPPEERDRVLGVRLPKLQALAAQIIKGDTNSYLAKQQDEYYEQTMLYGMVLGKARLPLEEKLKMAEAFLPRITNWAVCDSFCAAFKQARKEPQRVLQWLEPYVISTEEFTVRFALVMLLDYYIQKPYLSRLFDCVTRAEHPGYYAKMAKAWLLSICLVKEWEPTLEYLSAAQLDEFVYQKALQKAVESRRVSGEQRLLLKKMKRQRRLSG